MEDGAVIAGNLSETIWNSDSVKWYGTTVTDSLGKKTVLPLPGDTLKIVAGPEAVHSAKFLSFENRRIVGHVLNREKPMSFDFKNIEIYNTQNQRLLAEHIEMAMTINELHPQSLIVQTGRKKIGPHNTVL